MKLKLSPKFLSRNAVNIVLRMLVALRHHLAQDFWFPPSQCCLLPSPSPYILLATTVLHVKLTLQNVKQNVLFRRFFFPSLTPAPTIFPGEEENLGSK